MNRSAACFVPTAGRRFLVFLLLAFSSGCLHRPPSGRDGGTSPALRAVKHPEWIPVSDGFDFPVGGRDATGAYRDPQGKRHVGWYVAAGFLDPNYRGSASSWQPHPAEDWNGKGMGDTDLGQPVRAVAHGRVVRVVRDAGAWGNMVMIAHRLQDGTVLFSVYAHLQKVFVREGQRVKRGRKIGTIGKGGHDRYWAHLHFELRRANMASLPITYWPAAHGRDADWVRRHYLAPTPFIRSHRPADRR